MAFSNLPIENECQKSTKVSVHKKGKRKLDFDNVDCESFDVKTVNLHALTTVKKKNCDFSTDFSNVRRNFDGSKKSFTSKTPDSHLNCIQRIETSKNQFFNEVNKSWEYIADETSPEKVLLNSSATPLVTKLPINKEVIARSFMINQDELRKEYLKNEGNENGEGVSDFKQHLSSSTGLTIVSSPDVNIKKYYEDVITEDPSPVKFTRKRYSSSMVFKKMPQAIELDFKSIKKSFTPCNIRNKPFENIHIKYKDDTKCENNNLINVLFRTPPKENIDEISDASTPELDSRQVDLDITSEVTPIKKYSCSVISKKISDSQELNFPKIQNKISGGKMKPKCLIKTDVLGEDFQNITIKRKAREIDKFNISINKKDVIPSCSRDFLNTINTIQKEKKERNELKQILENKPTTKIDLITNTPSKEAISGINLNEKKFHIFNGSSCRVVKENVITDESANLRSIDMKVVAKKNSKSVKKFYFKRRSRIKFDSEDVQNKLPIETKIPDNFPKQCETVDVKFDELIPIATSFSCSPFISLEILNEKTRLNEGPMSEHEICFVDDSTVNRSVIDNEQNPKLLMNEFYNKNSTLYQTSGTLHLPNCTPESEKCVIDDSTPHKLAESRNKLIQRNLEVLLEKTSSHYSRLESEPCAQDDKFIAETPNRPISDFYLTIKDNNFQDLNMEAKECKKIENCSQIVCTPDKRIAHFLSSSKLKSDVPDKPECKEYVIDDSTPDKTISSSLEYNYFLELQRLAKLSSFESHNRESKPFIVDDSTPVKSIDNLDTIIENCNSQDLKIESKGELVGKKWELISTPDKQKICNSTSSKCSSFLLDTPECKKYIIDDSTPDKSVADISRVNIFERDQEISVDVRSQKSNQFVSKESHTPDRKKYLIEDFTPEKPVGNCNLIIEDCISQDLIEKQCQIVSTPGKQLSVNELSSTGTPESKKNIIDDSTPDRSSIAHLSVIEDCNSEDIFAKIKEDNPLDSSRLEDPEVCQAEEKNDYLDELHKKRLKKGSLVERAYKTVLKMKNEVNLFNHEINFGLRSAEDGAYISDRLIVSDIWKEDDTFFLKCLSLFDTAEIARNQVDHCFVTLIVSELASGITLNSHVVVHFPVNILFKTKSFETFVFVGNRVRSCARKIDSDQLCTKPLEFFIKCNDNKIEKKIIRTLSNNMTKNILDAVAGFFLVYNNILELNLIHVYTEKNTLHLLALDSEREVCIVLIKNFEDNKIKFVPGQTYEVKGFKFIDINLIDRKMYCLLDYLTLYQIKSNVIYTFAPFKKKWEINFVSENEQIDQVLTSLFYIKHLNSDYRRFNVMVEKAVLENSEIRLYDNTLLNNQFIILISEIPLDDHMFEGSFLLDTVYYLKGDLIFDNYSKIVRK